MANKNSARKSVCFLTHELITGGIENVLIEALKVLHDQYDVEVVSLYKGAEKAVTDAFPPNVTVKVGPFVNNTIIEWLKSRFYLSKIYFERALDKRYDYIISLKALERKVCFSNRGSRYICWCHNDSHRKFMVPSLSKIEKRGKRHTRVLYNKQHMVWTVNEIIAEEVKTVFAVNNVYALPNPINCTAIVEKAAEPCDVVFDKTNINIVLLGRLSAEKGFGRILRMMHHHLRERFPHVHVYVIGGGPAEQRIQDKLIEWNLCDAVTLLGTKQNPYPYVKQADVLIAPSRYESFGLAMMEAMLLGVPVITTDTTGGRYVTQNGRYACCVENNDEALQEALCQFLEDPTSYRYAKEEAQRWVWKHDTKQFGQKLLALLSQCDET